MTDTTAELSISRMNWLVSAGYTALRAGFRITKRKISQRFRFSAIAASIWPLGMDSIPARMISVA